MENLLKEIKRCVGLPNSGLVTIYAAQIASGGDTDCIQLMTEYEEESIAAVMDKCIKFSVTVAVSIIKQVVSVLLNLKSFGLGHRCKVFVV